LEGGGAADAAVLPADDDAEAQAAAIRAVFPLLAYLPGGWRHRYVLDRALRLLRRPPALQRGAANAGRAAIGGGRKEAHHADG
jgi:hypothetical protein